MALKETPASPRHAALEKQKTKENRTSIGPRIR
jgi:hypothetical protein